MSNLPDHIDASFEGSQSGAEDKGFSQAKPLGKIGIIAAILKSIGQMHDPRFRKVILMGIAGAFVVFVGLWTMTSHLMAQVIWTDLPLLGSVFEWMATFAMFEWVAGALFVGGMIFVTFFLFPAVMTGVMGLFTDAVCDAVEDKHYPHLGATRHQLPSEMILNAVKFIALVIGLNILALPIYAILFFMPPLNLVFFYLLNGYLLGREFYEQAALRRLTPREVQKLRRKNNAKITSCGILVALVMTIPFVNLIVPVLASAMMTHIFHHLPNAQNMMDNSAHKSEAKSA